MSDLDTAVAIYERAFQQGDAQLFEEILGDGFVQHEGGATPGPRSAQQMVDWVVSLRAAFPDLEFEVLSATVDAAGDVWLHACCRGTHRGPFANVPATGRRIHVNFLDRLQFRAGKLVQHWGATDYISLLQQIGAPVPW